MFIPTPFARVQVCLRLLPQASPAEAYDTAALQAALDAALADAAQSLRAIDGAGGLERRTAWARHRSRRHNAAGEP